MTKADLEKLNCKEIEELTVVEGFETPYKGGTKKEDYIDQVIEAFHKVKDIQETAPNTEVPESSSEDVVDFSDVVTQEEEQVETSNSDEETVPETKPEEINMEEKQAKIEELIFKQTRIGALLRNSPSPEAKKILSKNLAKCSAELAELGYKEE